MIHEVIVRKTEVRLHDVGQQRLATILVCGGTGGTVAANDEANGKCKENVEGGPVVLGPVKGEASVGAELPRHLTQPRSSARCHRDPPCRLTDRA